MVNLMIQIFNSMSLIIGIIFGGFVATKAFGTMKKSYQYLIELIAFIALITIILNTIQINAESIIASSSVFFIVGSSTIIFVRSITSALGYGTKVAKNVVVPPKEKSVELSILIRNLKKKGIKHDDILDIMKGTEFRRLEVKKALKHNVFERIPRKK